MIAIAVAASLVAYAWIMGYLSFTTQKVGMAVQVQSIATDNGNLVVYVQNVGQGTVEFKTDSSIYVNDELKTILNVDNNPLEQGKTATIMTDYPVTAGEPLKVKVVAADGTFTESTNPQGAAIPSSVTLTVNPSTGGSVTKDPDQSSYAYGTEVTLTATPEAGYAFDSWSGHLTGNDNPATVTMNGNKIISATFIQNEYTLSITVSPPAGGSVSKNPDQPTYHFGDSVQLTANANLGYTFIGWSGDLTGSTSPATVIIDENPEVTATFTQVFDHFGITAPTSATAGQSFGGVTVTAYDAGNNVVTGYSGQVYFTSSDGSATLPYTAGSKYTFVSGDNGVHTFSGFTLRTAGSRTITVTDGTKSATSSPITVSSSALASFVFNTISTQTTSTLFSITITAKDAYGNTVTSYTGTNTLSYSGGSGTINPTSTVAFTAGVWTGQVRLYKSGTGMTISTTGGGKSGTSNTFNVNAAQVTYVSAGTGSGTTGNPTPAYPSGLQLNDLILLQVTVRDTGTTPSTPSGFTLLPLGPDSTGIGRQWIYYKFSTGSETGTITVTIGGSSCKMARMYAFRNVALSSFYEGGGFKSGASSTISAQSVWVTGTQRLAVSFVFVNDDYNVDSFTGEVDGNWVEAVAEFKTDFGSDGCVQLQTTTVNNPPNDVYNGWYTMSGSTYWGIRAFALKPQ